MKFQELTTLLEQDGETIFISRDNDRQKRYQQILQRKIQNYIKNGSKGHLNLTNTPIKTLPDGLQVGGTLDLYRTPISKQYTSEQLKTMYPGVKGKILI